ncbi:MAG: type II secretion system protein [Planctomycetota bacterium]
MKRTSGFTLAEVAVTIVIVGIGMLLVLQGLNTAKMTAAQTRNVKLSRDLALLTLGQVASGQFQEEIENGLSGTYAEEGYPQFSYEVLVGDDAFDSAAEQDGSFDTWRHQQQLKEEREAERARESEDEEDPKESEEPFEKVKIRVTFVPKIRIDNTELKNEIVLEEWMPWKQVYGESEDAEAAPAGGAEAGAAPAPAGGGK